MPLLRALLVLDEPLQAERPASALKLSLSHELGRAMSDLSSSDATPVHSEHGTPLHGEAKRA